MPFTDPEKNRAYHKAYHAKWRLEHLEEIAARSKAWWAAHPKERKEKTKRYNARNPDRVRDRNKRRYHSRAHHRIANSHRRRLNFALLRHGSPERVHIESLFTDGMHWGNRGKGKSCWQIDHIMPLSAFELENEQHQILAFHVLNLQPLWCAENELKGSKIGLPRVHIG